ncbi:MAG: ABC transporter ATP-binding protein [Bacilli bacterium]|jgi:putative ABC transport system permease protein
MQTPVLKIIQLSKTFSLGKNDFLALKDISIAFPKTGFVLISGKSGSGKSTLLNLIAGIHKPSEGHVFYRDKAIDAMSERHLCAYRNRELGFVFQQYNLFDKQSVLFNVILPLLIDGKGIAKAYETGEQLLKLYGMEEMAKRDVAKLSGGEKQRVAIIRAIINNPAIVLADEPTGALDRQNAERTMLFLKEISSERLVIVVSHDLELVRSYSTRHIEIKDGKVAHDSGPIC